jgi:hypothetical protein
MTDSEFLGLSSLLLGPEDSGAVVRGVQSAAGSWSSPAAGARSLAAHGQYVAECYDAEGRLKWRDTIDNVVMTEGKNLAFDSFLAGSAYTVTGPYMGLILSVSFTATAAADVGTQINGTNQWKEAGGANAPTYTGNRPTCAWSSASGGAKALSSALSFAITGSGTVEGCFILFGSAAVATKDDAHGTLWSAGVFTGGTKVVANLDTLNVSYQTSL